MIKADLSEVFQEITGQLSRFPRYTTQLMNIANQNSQGTRPRQVGQLSELIQNVPVKTYDAWKEWYESQYGHKIEGAVDKIHEMIENFKEAILQIDEEMIRKWVEDLIYVKTAEGFIIQEFILKTVAERMNSDYRVATPEEESRCIDGYIGDIAVQVKPKSYQLMKPTVHENIDVELIEYEKTNDYLKIYTGLLDED